MSILYPILIFLFFLSNYDTLNDNGIKIEWKDNIEGDFSFTKKWNYADYVYKNDIGQLVCNGICNPLTDIMKDENGKIIEDSLNRYYQLVDTTHIFHTIESISNSYEWAGTDNIAAKRTDKDTVICYTLCNAATHSSLLITIVKNKCIPKIEFNSITDTANPIYFSHKKGYIIIDKNLWNKGIIKAEFSFLFHNHENQKRDLFWKGKIYSVIK